MLFILYSSLNTLFYLKKKNKQKNLLVDCFYPSPSIIKSSVMVFIFEYHLHIVLQR